MEKLPNEILEIILNNLSASDIDSDIDLINFGRAYNSSKNKNSRIFDFNLYYFLRKLKLKSRIKLIKCLIYYKIALAYHNWVNGIEEFNEYTILVVNSLVKFNVYSRLLVADSSAVLRYHSGP